MAQRILVVDDDTAMREMMALALRKEGYSVSATATSSAALTELEKHRFDLVVTDIYIDEGTGLDLLEASRRSQPGTPVILVTAHGTIETAASARRAGVFDYLAKPFEIEHLVTRVQAALGTPAKNEVVADYGPASMIIGSSPAIVEVYDAVARVAPMPIPVLVHGETGTGKELIARALHQFGANPDGPFVPLNCGGLPESLLESELFGHRKGSFTGADRDHRGAIEAARGGTLLLDEVGELPTPLQVKLLRFLQSGEIRPVGAEHSLHVPVRVVAATHRDLRAEARSGRFREDFYYRLAAYEISLPALRDRRSDIPALVDHFRSVYADRFGLGSVSGATPEVMDLLLEQPWPGNVRQLEHAVQRALVDSGSLADPDAMARVLLKLSVEEEVPPSALPAAGDEISIRDLEKAHIEAVLRRCGGHRTRAAEILGIERKSLYRKAKRYGIPLDPEEGER